MIVGRRCSVGPAAPAAPAVRTVNRLRGADAFPRVAHHERVRLRLFSGRRMVWRASQIGVLVHLDTSLGSAAGCVDRSQNSILQNHRPMHWYQRRGFAWDTSSVSARELVVELTSRIDQDEDIVRARLLASEANSVHDTEQRALKDIASEFCEAYLSSDQIPLVAGAESTADDDNGQSREAVILYLLSECGVDFSAVDQVVSSYQDHANGPSMEKEPLQERHQLSVVTKMRQACSPGYLRVFNHILSDSRRNIGLACLIELRSDVRMYARRLERRSSGEEEDTYMYTLFCLKQMDNELRTLLATLFLQPILDLRRITYEDTPAAVIEKVAMKEAVHPLRSLDDLRTRLGPNRRCFAFFHPSLPNEPLIFVHVALLSRVPETMEEIDNYTSSDEPKVATFYSITNTQPGLVGVDLGGFLIKRVVEELQMEFSGINTFCTLSPIPRLRNWIESKLCQEEKFFDASLIGDSEMKSLAGILGCQLTASAPGCLVELLKDASWYEQGRNADALEPVLMKLAAHYLTKEKHRGRPIDGVAKFHIRNGAEMYRLNWMADKSRKGMHNSAGMMINYRYDFDTIEKNNVAYESTGRIPVKEGVSKWLGECK